MIREMKRGDWDDMMAVYQQSLDTGGATFQTECPSYEEWDAGHIKECRFVYETDGHVVGYAVIAPTSSRACYRGVVEVSIYVDRSYSGQGIGTKLLKMLMKESEKHGYWTLFSVIISDNTDSLRLHSSCGFRIIGTREDVAKDKFGNWKSTILMEWRNHIR